MRDVELDRASGGGRAYVIRINCCSGVFLAYFAVLGEVHSPVSLNNWDGNAKSSNGSNYERILVVCGVIPS